MSEQIQVQPHVEESSQQPAAETTQEVIAEIILEEDIFIDDLLEEAKGVAASFKKKDGQ